MDIKVFIDTTSNWEIDLGSSFLSGIRRHNQVATIHPIDEGYIPCDIAVVWTMQRSRHIRNAHDDRDWILIDRGYVGDRMKICSIGYNGLNGHADFMNEKSPPDRWEKYFDGFLKPWHFGDYILVTGQVPNDASVENIDLDYQGIVDRLCEITDRPIWFKPHPQHQNIRVNAEIVIKKTPIADALKDAHCLVTYNSNSAVDALLAGTPCITLAKGSMVEGLSSNKLIDAVSPPTPHRDQWAYNIAYAQWDFDEISQGLTWEHLKRRYD